MSNLQVELSRLFAVIGNNGENEGIITDPVGKKMFIFIDEDHAKNALEYVKKTKPPNMKLDIYMKEFTAETQADLKEVCFGDYKIKQGLLFNTHRIVQAMVPQAKTAENITEMFMTIVLSSIATFVADIANPKETSFSSEKREKALATMRQTLSKHIHSEALNTFDHSIEVGIARAISGDDSPRVDVFNVNGGKIEESKN